MAQAFTAETTISRPIDEVWDALVDWDNADQWMSGVEGLSAAGETAVGTELTFRSRGKDRSSRVTALEPGRLMSLRSEQGGVAADYTYRVEEVEPSTTRVQLVAECDTSGTVWRIVAPLIRVAIRRTDGHQLDDLKRHVEAGAA